MTLNISKFCAATIAIISASTIASAATLEGVGTYEGVAGTLGPNGVVTAPPAAAGSSNYIYITTAGSNYTGAGLGIGSEHNGTALTTLSFSAEAGDTLSYFFNYVTSDGSSYTEYAYAALNDISGSGANNKLIFTARTTPNGDTVPGFGLPAIADGVTLVPENSAIIAGGPIWSPLGEYSGDCFNSGCGYTGWIQSLYTIEETGIYSLTFGVVNWTDSLYDTGLAIAGLKINGEIIVTPDPIPPVPVPAGGLLLISGLGAVAAFRRIRPQRG